MLNTNQFLVPVNNAGIVTQQPLVQMTQVEGSMPSAMTNQPQSQSQALVPTVTHLKTGADAIQLGNLRFVVYPDFPTYLKNASSFHIKQKLDIFEVVANWEEANRYEVMDNNGQTVMHVLEESNCCTRQCCGSCRSFRAVVKDWSNNNVMIFERPTIDCDCCCGICCPDSMEVSNPLGQKLGSIRSEISFCKPKFAMFDATGNRVLRIEGPFCICECPCCKAVEFKLIDNMGNQVGGIYKNWSGWARELYTRSDNFTITFPVNLDQSMKAVCLGALFLIDFEYFEGQNRTSSFCASFFGGVVRGIARN